MTFGEKLQIIRKHHALSQEELAHKLEVSRQTVHRWESGQSLPDIPKILQISELFSVSTDYLLHDKIDNSIGKMTDYETLKIVFWITTLVNFGGLIISVLGWREYQNFIPVLLGMLLGVFGCVSYEVFRPRNADKVLLRYARRQFYALNVWLLLPTPFYIIVELLWAAEQMKPLMPYLAGGAAYLVVSAGISIYMLHKFKN